MARPRVYKDTYPDELLDQMGLGKFDYEVYADWNICKDTFYRWLNEYEDLKESYDIGWVKCYKWWTTVGKERFAERDEKGFKYWIAIMNNKFSWGKDESQAKGNTTNININQINVLQNQSASQLKEFIKAKLELNKDVIDVKLIEIDQP